MDRNRPNDASNPNEMRILADSSAFRKSAIPFAMLTLCALAIAPLGASARDRRDRDESSETTTNQIVDRTDASIAGFKADLRLTPDQEKNWGAVQTALHDIAKRGADRSAKLREDRAAVPQRSETKESATGTGKAGSAHAWTTIDEMRAEADATSAHAADLRAFADVAGPFYDSLDAGQQRRFGSFIHGYFSEAHENSRRH